MFVFSADVNQNYQLPTALIGMLCLN